jgi:uncharacterized protein
MEIAQALIENGANVNARSYFGRTSLDGAACRDHINMLHLPIENGADPEAQDYQGQRAFHWATMSGGLHVVKELVSTFNVDINARDNNARTVLGLQRNDAVPYKIYPDIINFLQSNGGIV